MASVNGQNVPTEYVEVKNDGNRTFTDGSSTIVATRQADATYQIKVSAANRDDVNIASSEAQLLEVVQEYITHWALQREILRRAQ
jgi:hypothetical protein